MLVLLFYDINTVIYLQLVTFLKDPCSARVATGANLEVLNRRAFMAKNCLVFFSMFSMLMSAGASKHHFRNKPTYAELIIYLRLHVS